MNNSDETILLESIKSLSPRLAIIDPSNLRQLSKLPQTRTNSLGSQDTLLNQQSPQASPIVQPECDPKYLLHASHP